MKTCFNLHTKTIAYGGCMKLYLIYILASLIAYFVGSISTSLIISKLKKKDLRAGGSKNLGASNTTLLMGWKYGVIVGVCDILKGTLVVVLARLIFPDYAYLPYAVGTAAVLGHIYPCYLKFKGGKGFATYVGIILGLDWRFFLIIGVSIILITLITDYIALGTFTTMVTFPLWLFFMSDVPWAFLIPTLASVIIIVKHFENIKRILKKEELGLRASFKKKKADAEK